MDYMRADEDYQYALTWLTENGMEHMAEPEEEAYDYEPGWDEEDEAANEPVKKGSSKKGTKRTSK